MAIDLPTALVSIAVMAEAVNVRLERSSNRSIGPAPELDGTRWLVPICFTIQLDPEDGFPLLEGPVVGVQHQPLNGRDQLGGELLDVNGGGCRGLPPG